MSSISFISGKGHSRVPSCPQAVMIQSVERASPVSHELSFGAAKMNWGGGKNGG
jgi:hypothetical protein